ncbi:hypothetical protein BDV32DRAFT_30584 [Aspergillus pseudonomiae]|nr:hypothetical protein BDV32DRAFT_30584 [Aspergillus pseudonomiae]
MGLRFSIHHIAEMTTTCPFLCIHLQRGSPPTCRDKCRYVLIIKVHLSSVSPTIPGCSDPLLFTSDRRIDRTIGQISSHDPGSNPALPPRPAVSATALTIPIFDDY